MSLSRREFLGSMTLFSALGMAPAFLARAAAGPDPAVAPGVDAPILVVVQLGGGNDGLNTVVPYGDDTYYRMRPALGLRKDRLLTLNDHLAFNDQLRGFMDLYGEGQLAIIQGTGYPNPDRSHFRATEIWETASGSNEYLGSGWLGRYFDNCCAGAPPQVGLAVGPDRPQAFECEGGYGVATEAPERFGWDAGPAQGAEEAFETLNHARPTENDTLDFLRHTTTQALLSSAEVRRAAEKGRVASQLKPGRGLTQLDTVAGLIRGGLATRVYYVSTGGFDTHANQLGQQDRLLGGVASALQKFQKQLKSDGTADRVITLVFSEFGRRVAENGSGGTDHGTAAPAFLMGESVAGGIHGQTPSLTDLDRGDLKYTTDFRQIYATLLKDWLKADAGKILNQDFKTLPILA
jgi:uncharacterized protein (DUF1501 family)